MDDLRHFSRRESLVLGAGLAVSACSAGQRLHTSGTATSLNALAERRDRRFGSTVGSRNGAFADPRYIRLLTAECGVIVPENELKWGWIRKTPTTFDFDAADRILAFAEANRLAMRGHTLLWHHPKWFPQWVANYDFGTAPATEAARMIREHVATVCSRYGTRILSYDVVNEAVDNHSGALRETAFSRAMGSPEAVLDLAFHTARETAPRAQLVYNDYMSWEPSTASHRAGVLRLLEGFRKRGTPVDALGVQSHIGADNNGENQGFGARQETEWRHFLDEATGMGYNLVITELDVHDNDLPADIATRDRAVADFGGAYLDLMLSYPQLGDVLCWGLCDRYSWLQEREPRPDGLAKRPCPYDADFRPKPLRGAIADAFANAKSAGSKAHEHRESTQTGARW